ncbi:o-succinylbenzoate synthase [Clostridium malenominatum]|uniref:o-succinylbenzoate synthase n=1 Tax=Clostridium malenominatum TaxID=1539 RepID=A0ABP3TVM3_9CLOT
MKIDESLYIEGIRIVEVNILYAIPFQISGGISHSRKSLIIELLSQGLVAYGESAPFEAPFYSSETISSAKSMLTEWIIPKILGKKFETIKEFNEEINNGIRGNNFAKAGVETAYWDLVAKKNNISLKKLIEYKLREMGTKEDYLKNKDYIYSGVSIGIPDDNNYVTLENWVEKYLEEGYKRVKIKIRPGWDIKPIELTRKIVGDDFILWPDANASFDFEEHREVLKKMDLYNCNFIEQPLHHDDILEHHSLSKYINTPICFDESLKSERVAKQIIELNFPSIWNIKIQRVGGLYEALKIYSLASKYGVEVWGGTMPESGIGGASILALSTFEGFKYPACIEPSSRWYGKGKDIKELIMDSNGRIELKEEIGIGEINIENYKKYGSLLYEIYV